MALEQDFEVFSGNDVLLMVKVLDSDTGEPLSLVGAQELIWAMGKTASAAPIITKSLSQGGIVITDQLQGDLEITIDATDLEPLKGVFYHELRLTNAAGKKVTLMYGTATIAVNLIRD